MIFYENLTKLVQLNEKPAVDAHGRPMTGLSEPVIFYTPWGVLTHHTMINTPQTQTPLWGCCCTRKHQILFCKCRV